MARGRTPKPNQNPNPHVDKRRVHTCSVCSKTFDHEPDMKNCWIGHYMRGET